VKLRDRGATEINLFRKFSDFFPNFDPTFPIAATGDRWDSMEDFELA
jgi:hypothetical protein